MPRNSRVFGCAQLLAKALDARVQLLLELVGMDQAGDAVARGHTGPPGLFLVSLSLPGEPGRSRLPALFLVVEQVLLQALAQVLITLAADRQTRR